MGTVSLLEACRNSGESVKSIVVSTSDKAFGHAEIPYTEKTALNPLYTYETSKACQQMITMSYFHNYGLPTKVVASSNVYGPGDPNLSRIIPNTIMRLANGEPALLFDGAAEHIREFVYIEDVANAFVTVARKGKNGEVYCCGGTEHLSMIDLIVHICKEMGKDPDKDIKTFQKSRYFKEIEQQYIDSTKLRSIGWGPMVSLDEGIRRTIKYYTDIARAKK
jgi:nucleoside-diphosphate-sugar epimerase